MKVRVLRWPYPRRWAFGITDDTDYATLESTRTVYEYCLKLGIWPTRTVWAFRPSRPEGLLQGRPPKDGITLEEPEYREYCRDLSQRGIEFCSHGASSGNNTREETIRSLEVFKQTFGHYPRVYVCHGLNADNPYWGESQFKSRGARWLVRLLTRKEVYQGHDPRSAYYWSDICRKTIDYVRLYRTLHLNALRPNPMMPYHQYDKPDVHFWFTTCAQDLDACRRVSPEALDQIAAEDGAFILYAHMAGFPARDGSPPSGLKPEVEKTFQTIAGREDCWCAGVSRILDRCLATKNVLVRICRHALVVSNPTSIALDGFQIRAGYAALYRPSGEVLHPDHESRFHVGELPGHSCVTLYFSPEEARVGDPAGVSRFEQIRVLLGEARRQLWQKRLHKKRR